MYNLASFISGNADIVRCFCCDLGVAEWDYTDDVWVEHARHSSTCWFLKNQKGEEFIKNVQVRWKKVNGSPDSIEWYLIRKIMQKEH